MLARGATAKILASEQNACAPIAGLIEHELFAPGSVPPIVKKELAKTCPLNTFKKLLGDNLVGVHICSIEWRDQSLMNAKRLHFVLSGSSMKVSALSSAFLGALLPALERARHFALAGKMLSSPTKARC